MLNNTVNMYLYNYKNKELSWAQQKIYKIMY